MKTCSPTNFPSPLNNMFLAVTENKFIVWNHIFSDPTSIYLFEFSNNIIRIKREILKVNNRCNRRCGVFIIYFEYIWHVSSVFFSEFQHVNARWNTLFFWSKFIFLNEIYLHVTFKTKLSVTAVNNSFQLLPIFVTKSFILDLT